MSADLIVIGDDDSGDRLCLKANGGIVGNEIYIWYHEDGELEEYASNLKEFIFLLSEENEDNFEYK
jgi:hypothetical protein